MSTWRLLCFLLIGIVNNAWTQNPCTGTPSPNSITPAPVFTLCSGSTTTLGLVNTYSNSGITYSWSTSSTSTVGPWQPINGANARNYAPPPQTDTNFFMVTITCTNSGLSIQLPVTVLVVPCYTPCSGMPSNTLVPATQTICAGDSAILGFAQTYSLTTGNSFQWQASPSASGPFTAVPGATTSAFSSGTLQSTMYYQAVVTCSNGGQSFTTTPSAVNVVSCTSCFGTPSFNFIVGPSTVCAGTQATLGLAQTYTSTGITFQWQWSTVSPVGPFTTPPGATLSSFVTPSLNTIAYYQVIITCTNSGQSFTAMHSVSVVPCPTPCIGFPGPSSIFPPSQVICMGDSTFMALGNQYNNITGLTFQWQSSPTVGGPYAPIAGATGTTYSTPALTTGTFYQVVVTCTSVGASYTTSPHPIAVIMCTNCFGTPGSNTIVPTSVTLCPGSSTVLSLANTYTAGGITYQWLSSTLSPVGPYNPVTGAVSPVYATPTLTQTTYYSVLITCTLSGQTIQLVSGVHIVSCDSLCSGAPINTVVPLNHTVCIGDSAQMTLATTYTTFGHLYQWYSGSSQVGPFIPIAGATSATFAHGPVVTNTFFQVVITCTASGQTMALVHPVTVSACTPGAVGERGFQPLRIFPNPARDQLIVEANGEGELVIEDLAGRIVWRQRAKRPLTVVTVAWLEPGVYLVRFRNNDHRAMGRFVKE